MSSSSMINSFKDLGNIEFRRHNYRQAVQLYTEALDCVDDTVPIETQRILLANRAKALVFYGGIIHEALRDLNQALSPQYTTQDSPRNLTAKYRYRRAKLFGIMARYAEAQADYGEFASIMGQLGAEISEDELEWKNDLDSRAAAGDDSEQRRRDELLRAIHARGFIIRQAYRDTFPSPPPEIQEHLNADFCPESMTISFDTPDSKPDHNLPDPNLTPISMPITIRVPYYHPDPDRQPPFSTRDETPLSENEPIGSVIDGLFTSMAINYHNQAAIPLAIAHDRDAVLLMMTYRGRLLKIPRETTFKDVVAGARWPRQPNAPVFEDLRRPRKWSDEIIDGPELSMGWMTEVYVVAQEFTSLLEQF